MSIPICWFSLGPFQPGVVPSSLNHLGIVPLGHYLSAKIPFLFPPPRIVSTPVMAALSLPNITLGIPIWYINPPANIPPNQFKHYTTLTLVQPIALSPSFALVPQQPQQESTPIMKASGEGGKPRKRETKKRHPKQLPLLLNHQGLLLHVLFLFCWECYQ